MKNIYPNTAVRHLAHEELQRLAREAGRAITEQEIHALTERLLHGATADAALEAMRHELHHGAHGE